MAWIIVKSAGDEFSFATVLVEGQAGYSRQYAEDIARRVTAAMLAAQERDEAMQEVERLRGELVIIRKHLRHLDRDIGAALGEATL